MMARAIALLVLGSLLVPRYASAPWVEWVVEYPVDEHWHYKTIPNRWAPQYPCSIECDPIGRLEVWCIDMATSMRVAPFQAWSYVDKPMPGIQWSKEAQRTWCTAPHCGRINPWLTAPSVPKNCPYILPETGTMYTGCLNDFKYAPDPACVPSSPDWLSQAPCP